MSTTSSQSSIVEEIIPSAHTRRSYVDVPREEQGDSIDFHTIEQNDFLGEFDNRLRNEEANYRQVLAEIKHNSETLHHLKEDEVNVRLQMALNRQPSTIVDKPLGYDDLYDLARDTAIVCKAALAVTTYAEVNKALVNGATMTRRLSEDISYANDKVWCDAAGTLKSHFEKAQEYYRRNCSSRHRSKVQPKHDIIIRISDHALAGELLPLLPKDVLITTSARERTKKEVTVKMPKQIQQLPMLQSQMPSVVAPVAKATKRGPFVPMVRAIPHKVHIEQDVQDNKMKQHVQNDMLSLDSPNFDYLNEEVHVKKEIAKEEENFGWSCDKPNFDYLKKERHAKKDVVKKSTKLHDLMKKTKKMADRK